MFLSLIIPTHQRFFQVVSLLQSIVAQNFPPDQLEALLISNLRDKLLRAELKKWERDFLNFKYKELGLKGVNKARNMGIRFARGDILYFLDDDCLLPHRNHLKNIVQAHKNHPSVAGIGGPYKTVEGLAGREKFYHESSELWLDKAKQAGRQSSQLLGGNASYKKFIFEMGYYFDPGIAFGGSEESFNRSIKKYGLIVDESLGVYHYPQLKGLAFFRKSFGQGAGAFKNQSKNLKKEESFDSSWAFLHGNNLSFYSFLYQVFFKLGYFWESSSSKRGGWLFKAFRFVFLILKSRWYFIKSFFAGWFFGKVIVFLFGRVRYGLGWLYGRVIVFLFGRVRYGLGWLYGRVIVFLFHHSPPMKIYYFSRYQYHKRIKPFFNKRRSKNL